MCLEDFYCLWLPQVSPKEEIWAPIRAGEKKKEGGAHLGAKSPRAFSPSNRPQNSPAQLISSHLTNRRLESDLWGQEAGTEKQPPKWGGRVSVYYTACWPQLMTLIPLLHFIRWQTGNHTVEGPVSPSSQLWRRVGTSAASPHLLFFFYYPWHVHWATGCICLKIIKCAPNK